MSNKIFNKEAVISFLVIGLFITGYVLYVRHDQYTPSDNGTVVTRDDNKVCYSDSITSSELLTLTNKERAGAGLRPLVINDLLNTSSTLKTNDMLAKHYWAHTSPDGIGPFHWLDEAGYSYSYAGENLAEGFKSSEAVVTGWMGSPGHRANILKPEYTEVGFTISCGLTNINTTLVVAHYAAPK